MKIFISHSSKNEDYGSALVDLLIGVGITGDKIIFTSNDAYGIPTGENIFNWLKNRITEKPYVLYLLSPEYYTSVACMNEMGAAWVVENEHIMIFTPDFNLKSYEFQNGALDPREIGFYINNQDRLILFLESLKTHFPISANPVLINQKIREFLNRIVNLKSSISNIPSKKVNEVSIEEPTVISTESINTKSTKSNGNKITNLNQSNPTDRFFTDLLSNKLKTEEVILIHYIRETDKYKLGTGWQASNEIDNIKEWEDINELDNTLSMNYENVIRRFEMKKLTEVSDITSYDNPKEVKLIESFQQRFLGFSQDELKKIEEVIEKCPMNNYDF